MTAEPDLLPCPGCNGASVRVICGPGTKGGPQYWAGCDYCRWRTWGNTGAEAIAEWNRRATAARDAEVEALRAELERLTAFNDDTCESFNRLSVERTALITRAEQLAEEVEALRAEVVLLRRGIVPRDDDMIVPVKLLDEINASGAEWKDRAERLAEALRKWWAAHRPVGWTEDQHRACPYVNLPTDTDKALAEALLRDQEEGK